MIKKLIILLFILVSVYSSTGQNYRADSVHILKSKIEGTDTLPNYNMKEVKVFPEKKFRNKRHKRKYTRLMHNVRKAYPFALIARTELRIMNDSLLSIEGEKEQKKFIKEYEKEMFRRYETKLRKLTISQGRILLKLVDREIGNTSYELIKEYRGSFSAVFWQGIARIFGTDMKSAYDPQGEDAEIEEIVLLIEYGYLSVLN